MAVLIQSKYKQINLRTWTLLGACCLLQVSIEFAIKFADMCGHGQDFAIGTMWWSVKKKRSMVVISPSMDHQFRERVLAQWLWAGITVIAALCSHSAILLMSSVQPPQIQAALKAQWDTKEVFALLDYLTANESQGNGTGNFKDTMFIGTVTAISPLLSTGPPKTAKHCKTKWASVSLSVSFFSSSEVASKLFTA